MNSFENPKTRACRLVLVCLAWLALASQHAGADIVRRRSAQRQVLGTVANVSPDSVRVQVRNETQELPAGDVESIRFDGEPAVLNIARQAESRQNLDFALEKYREAEAAGLQGFVQTDVRYFIARTIARQALVDQGKLPEAAQQLEAFRDANPNSYHFYPLHQWLGDVYVRQERYDDALAAYRVLGRSKWAEFQLRARLGQARVHQRRKDFASAISLLEEVLRQPAPGPLEQQCRQEAILSKAKCLSLQGDADAAIQLLQEVIETAPNEATALQAQAFNLLGDCYYADRDASDREREKALIQYLYVDALPSLASHRQEHAKALFFLSKLWNETNPPHPERAEDARNRLQELYPNSVWVRQGSAR